MFAAKKEIAVAIAAALLLSCGGDKPATREAAADFLPGEFSAIGLKRISPVRSFEGQALWEYINGGAELYHNYGFVEVATADYKKDSVEIVADIYRFSSGVNAYGLYSMLRPEDAEVIMLGTEGYLSASSIQFVRGPYFVRVVAYDDSDETNLVLVNFVYALNKLFVVPQTPPEAFSLFPDSGRIAHTDKYWAGSYLGQTFLTSVYSRDYMLDTTHVTLFVSPSEADSKALAWSKLAGELQKLQPVPDGLPFDGDSGFLTEDGYYGKIVVGTCGGRLVGMVGYRDDYKPFLQQWLDSLM